MDILLHEAGMRIGKQKNEKQKVGLREAVNEFMSSFINFLKRNKLYSAVNLLGLSLSMAFVLLLAVYVTSQLSTDSFQKNADRIYVIAQKETLSSAYWLSRHMKANFPEIERSASYSSNGMQEYKIDGNIVNARTSYADSSFFDMFSFPLVEGDFSEWKASISGVLISESFAKAQFGDRDPVGREIRFDGADSTVSNLTVSGVFKDIENSIIRPCDIFLRGEIMTITNQANDERMSNAGSSTCFVMAYPNADLPARHDDILKWCRENFWRYMSDYGGGDNDVRIIPLRDVYFLSDGNEDYNDSLRLGNKTTVMLLAGMCFLLLLFAILNYVNMTTALSGFRAKEMATRRLIGATKGGIFMKMIVESTIICAAAMVIAVLLGEAISPAASKVLNYDISIFKAISPVSVLVCVLFTVLVGVIAGIVPALIIQKAEPIEIVRGTLRLKTKTLYSKVIIVIQNVITVVMLVTAFTMFLQIRSMINAPVGYNTEDQITISNEYGRAGELAPLINKLKAESCVEAVGLGDGYPMFDTNNWTMSTESGKEASFQMVKGDSAYFNILGIRKKQDNHSPNSYWLNEYAYGILEIDETATEFTTKSNSTWQIGGIYYDFKIKPLLEEQHPALIYQYDEYPAGKWPWTILVKTTPDHKEAFARVKAVFSELYPDKLFDASYVEDDIKAVFASENRVLEIMVIFTILSLFVSALGLVAMSSYYMQQERRTVSLKKVYGADYNSVLWSLVAEFMKMIGVAFVIAVPVAWYLMHTWLNGYSYRIGLHWWIFAVAGLFTAVIAALAVLWQAVRAARTNPAIELKKE